MGFIHLVLEGVGIWYIFWSLFALCSPSRAAAAHDSLWVKFGRLCDRLGLKSKSDKDA